MPSIAPTILSAALDPAAYTGNVCSYPCYSTAVHVVCMPKWHPACYSPYTGLHGYQRDMPQVTLLSFDRVVWHLLSWRAMHLINLHLALSGFSVGLSAFRLLWKPMLKSTKARCRSTRCIARQEMRSVQTRVYLSMFTAWVQTVRCVCFGCRWPHPWSDQDCDRSPAGHSLPVLCSCQGWHW